MQLMFEPFIRYADFTGRSRRMEYWLYTVWTSIVSLFLLLGFIGSVSENGGLAGLDGTSLNFLTIFIFWVVATIAPTLAVTIRRLHDRNFSGWFYLIGFIPYIGGLALTVMLLLDGTEGPNQYGPDPKERDGDSWGGDVGAPASYRAPARTTYDQQSTPPVPGGFSRRSQGFNQPSYA